MAWGLPVTEFWEQIPSTFNAIITGKQRLNQNDLERAALIQWFGEYLAREKRLKNASSYMQMLRPRKRQTGQDVLALFKGFQAAGVPVEIKKVIKKS